MLKLEHIGWKSMKVLLVQSPLGRKQDISFPIGLAYLASVLEKHEVTVSDPNTVEEPLHEIEKVVEKTHPDVIGVSLRNIDTTQSWDIYSYFEAFVQALKKIKEAEPSARTIAGGAGFSMFAKEIMKRVPEIDYGTFLEGEYTLPALFENLEHPERVPGVYLRRGQDVFFTGLSQPVEVDKLPIPKRDLPGLNLKKYKEAHFSMGIQTKRGCILNCSYCTYPLLQGQYVRSRSPKKVVDEMEQIRNLYDIDEIFFADTVFNSPPEHSREICKELIKRKSEIKWKAWYREDYMNKASMIEAQKAGCQLFEFSPDGGSQEALNVLQKSMSIREVVRTYETASKIEGIDVAFNFMYNIPGENLDTVASLLKLLTNIAVKCKEKLKWLGLTKIRIYPNTGVHKIALRQGFVSPGNDLLEPVFYDPSPFNIMYSIALSAFDRKNMLLLMSPRTVRRRLQRMHEEKAF